MRQPLPSMRLLRPYLLSAVSCVSSLLGAAAKDGALPVTIRVDASKTFGELKPIYRFFGADEPNYATMKDGRKLLRDIGNLHLTSAQEDALVAFMKTLSDGYTP